MLNTQLSLGRERTRRGLILTTETWQVIQVFAAGRENRQSAFTAQIKEKFVKLWQEES